MKPSQLASQLRRIAAGIDNSKNPSRRLVTQDIKRILVAVVPRLFEPVAPVDSDPNSKNYKVWIHGEGGWYEYGTLTSGFQNPEAVMADIDRQVYKMTSDDFRLMGKPDMVTENSDIGDAALGYTKFQKVNNLSDVHYYGDDVVIMNENETKWQTLLEENEDEIDSFPGSGSGYVAWGSGHRGELTRGIVIQPI